jgi:hypothetical protein
MLSPRDGLGESVARRHLFDKSSCHNGKLSP